MDTLFKIDRKNLSFSGFDNFIKSIGPMFVFTPNKKGNLSKKVRNPVTGELINVGSKKYKYLMNKRVIVKNYLYKLYNNDTLNQTALCFVRFFL